MSTVPVPLPDEPNFEQLKKQARDLQRAVRSGEPAAVALVAAIIRRVLPTMRNGPSSR